MYLSHSVHINYVYLSHSVYIHYVYLSHSVHIVYVYLSTSLKHCTVEKRYDFTILSQHF